MMHGWGMGFSLFGLLPLLLLGGGIYFLLRRRRSLPETQEPGAPEVFRLAKKYSGVLTVSDVVSELGIDPPEAEKLLEGLTDVQRVDMEVSGDGVVRYIFREL